MQKRRALPIELDQSRFIRQRESPSERFVEMTAAFFRHFYVIMCVHIVSRATVNQLLFSRLFDFEYLIFGMPVHSSERRKFLCGDATQ